MSELKPCPFCGSKTARIEEKGPFQYTVVSVRCNKCGACGPIVPTMNPRYISAAAEEWNNRYYSEDAAAEATRILDSLKEKLQKMRDNPENRRAE